MQINHYPHRYKKWAINLLKWSVMALCLTFIFQKMGSEKWDFSTLGWDRHLGILLAVGMLMVLNWYLEAEKWRLSVPGENLTLLAALNAVLGGLALNWLVPFTLGDAGARLANVRNRKHTVRAMVINRMVMLSLTGCFGAVSVWFYLYGSLNDWMVWSLALSLFLIFLWFILVGYLKVKAPKVQIIHRILILSILRYLVFSFQFYLLLRMFNPSLEALVIFFGIGWVFLFRSVIPSLFGNFGVREASAVVFFEPYVTHLESIIAACLCIWLINTVIPSVVGALSIFKLRVNIAR